MLQTESDEENPMNDESNQHDRSEASSFAEQAGGKQTGIVREFWDFLRFNKKWWLTPIIVVLMFVGALVMLSSTAAAPFIYTLF